MLFAMLEIFNCFFSATLDLLNHIEILRVYEESLKVVDQYLLSPHICITTVMIRNIAHSFKKNTDYQYIE